MLVLAVVIVQLGLHYTYLPWWCGDSTGYSSQASILYGSGFTKDPGERTPGYPLFLLGCEMLSPCRVAYWMRPQSAQFVTWAQSALSVASAVLLYLSMEKLHIRPGINFAISLLYALLVGVEQFAMCILSENLSVFTVALAGYVVTVVMDRWRRGLPVYSLALLSGFVYGAAIMVRPNLLPLWLAFVAVIPAVMIAAMVRRRNFHLAGAVSQITRPVFAVGTLIIIIWLLIHYENTGFLSLGGIGGITRTSVAYNLFDQVHPKDKVLGEIMVKYYHQTNWPGHIDRAYGWLALDEIDQRCHEMPFRDFPERGPVSDGAVFSYLEQVSNQLLWEHPSVWAENSLSDLRGTLDFHFFQTTPDELNDPVSMTRKPVVVSVRGWKLLGGIVAKEAGLVTLLYLFTFVALILAGKTAFSAADIRSRLAALTVFAFALGALLCMFAPSLVATYDNRYSVPLISLFAICAAYVIDWGWSFLKRSRDAIHS